MKKNINDVLFDVVTPLGFHVRVTRAYWQVIVGIKHPVMREKNYGQSKSLS